MSVLNYFYNLTDEEEPLLGQWITETLATASPVPSSGLRKLNRRRAGKAPEENDYVDLGVDEGTISGKTGNSNIKALLVIFRLVLSQIF